MWDEKLEEICGAVRRTEGAISSLEKYFTEFKEICRKHSVRTSTMYVLLQNEIVYRCPNCNTMNVYDHAEQQDINTIPPAKYICDNCGKRYDTEKIEKQDVLRPSDRTAEFVSEGGC